MTSYYHAVLHQFIAKLTPQLKRKYTRKLRRLRIFKLYSQLREKNQILFSRHKKGYIVSLHFSPQRTCWTQNYCSNLMQADQVYPYIYVKCRAERVSQKINEPWLDRVLYNAKHDYEYLSNIMPSMTMSDYDI